jgi:aminoglycoside phosphotransferase (APT) family kinase protein
MRTPDQREADTVRDLVQRRLPGSRVEALVPLGAGLDHHAYDVDGKLVVRVDQLSDSGRADRVRRELRLLRAAGAVSPVPVPEPVFDVPQAGVLAYRKLDGRPLLDVPIVERGALARSVAAVLGRLLAALHAVPLNGLTGVADVDAPPLEEWLAEAAQLYPSVEQHIAPEYRPAVEAFLDRTPPPPPGTYAFSHNDLGIEHVLVDEAVGRVNGVIDWSDAAIVDPARDFGLIYRDLGPLALDVALEAYGARPADSAQLRERAIFYGRCGGIEDLAYGIETGLTAYVEKSFAGLGWLFPVESAETRRK